MFFLPGQRNIVETLHARSVLPPIKRKVNIYRLKRSSIDVVFLPDLQILMNSQSNNKNGIPYQTKANNHTKNMQTPIIAKNSKKIDLISISDICLLVKSRFSM